MNNTNIQKLLVRNRSKRAKVAIPHSEVSHEDSTNMARLLWKYKEMWDAGAAFRRKRRRNLRYVFNDQWSDKVKVDNEWITESENISRQGKVPLQNNLIRALTKTILGSYRQNKVEPEAISRDRDEQELGEMMTIALQRACQINELEEVDAHSLMELMASGMVCQVVRYKWWRKEQINDVYVEEVNPARCFWNTDVADVRCNDIRTFGVISDYTLGELTQRFAKNRVDAVRLREIYNKNSRSYIQSIYQAFTTDRINSLDFFMPSDEEKCRVIEAWELESKERIQVHDKLNGELFICEMEDYDYLVAENEKRLAEAIENGFTEEEAEDALLLDYKWFYDQFWKVRYLSPFGDILFESETPYVHNEHPFEVMMYPMVDGAVHSLIEDMIDQQRYINRLITMIDFIMGASAKGVLVFPEDALGDMTKEEVLDEWVKYNGVIFAKIKPGSAMPTQISTNATNIGAYELLNLQMKLMQDVSGIHAAMQGQQAKAGTPSSLYAQETQNAQTNIVDMLDGFNSFRRRRDYKMMSLIQQYYDEPRYINIAGVNYSETAKWYNPEKIKKSSFDIVINESPATPAYRSIMNQFLLQVYQQGQMDLETLLETSSYPFSDKIIKHLRKKQAEMQQAQQAQQAQAMAAQQGQVPQQAAPAQMPQEEGMPADAMADIEQRANPEAMRLINQALQ